MNEIGKLNMSESELFPIIPMRNEERTRLDYTNSLKADHTYILDSIAIDSILRYYELFDEITVNDFEIVKGLLWNKTSNRLGEITQLLFHQRLLAKQAGNESLQQVLKLMLNSIYGKNLVRGTNYKDKYIHEDKLGNAFVKHFNSFKFIDKISKETYRMRTHAVDSSFNRQHVAVFILSMSKQIMNEYMKVCSMTKTPVYYTDTDSLHISRKNLDLISETYKETFGYDLFGNELGQFNDDLEIRGCDDVYSHKSIFLGKKSYLDQLRGIKKDTGEVVYSDIVKMYEGASQLIEGLVNDSIEKNKKIEALSDMVIKLKTEKPPMVVTGGSTADGRLVRVANYTRLDFN